MAKRHYDISPESRAAQSERMKARWAAKRAAAQQVESGVQESGPSPATVATRETSRRRLHALIEENKLKEGEVGPQPPTPPLHPKPEMEDMRGGAISAAERQIGVAPERPPQRLDIVRGRDESSRPVIAPVPQELPATEKLVIEIPDWETIDFADAEDWLKMFTQMEQEARAIINRRRGELLPTYECFVCKRKVPDGKERFHRDRPNPQTGLMERTVICSSACYSKWRLSDAAKPAAASVR